MKMLVFAGLLLVGYLVSLVLRAHRGFWRLVQEHPAEAFRHIQSERDAWRIADERPNPTLEWHGPFRLLEPNGGTLVTFWGHDPDYVESQARFIKNLCVAMRAGSSQ